MQEAGTGSSAPSLSARSAVRTGAAEVPQSSTRARGASSLTRRRSIGEVVADHVRILVFEGSLRDGDRVPQREIAQALGVSALPVREAVVALEREGVVTIVPNRGAFANGLDPDVVTEQFHVFGRVYGLAVGRAARRADADRAEAASWTMMDDIGSILSKQLCQRLADAPSSQEMETP